MPAANPDIEHTGVALIQILPVPIGFWFPVLYEIAADGF